MKSVSKARRTSIRWDQMTDRIRRMDSMIKTEQDAVDHWDDAETLIETYLDAVASHSANLPTGVELGEACLWLIVLLASDPNGDGLRLCGELLESTASISLLALEHRVRSFHQSAIIDLKQKAKCAHQKLQAEKIPLESTLF